MVSSLGFVAVVFATTGRTIRPILHEVQPREEANPASASVADGCCLMAKANMAGGTLRSAQAID